MRKKEKGDHRGERSGKNRKGSRRSRSSFSLPPVKGIFSANAAGFGFVKPQAPEEAELFIPPKYTSGALDGDLVEARIIEEPERGPVGKILSILERRRNFVVAELNSSHSARPLDRKLPEEIKVNSLPRGMRRGQWVRLRLLNGGPRHTESLRGTFEETIGPAGTVEGDLQAIAEEYDLPDPYTPEQERAASRLTPAERVAREDCTGLFTVTIDPVDAKDFDDAISIMPAEKKTELRLGIHIADVAAWVRPGSVFDREAAKRSFSSYIPGRFSPMLPKSLTGKLSLREGADSLAHSVLFTVRKSDGKLTSCRRVHSRIRVDKRLDFASVQKFIDDPVSAPPDWSGELKEKLALLLALVRKMRARRKKEEAFLNIDTAEVRVLCDEESKQVTGIERKIQGEADLIVEECMLAANSAVAAEIIERGIPGLFRVHDEPSPEKMEEFSCFVDSVFHMSTGDLLASRAACTHFLESLPEDHRKPVILSHFLRSLPRAVYSTEPSLHYGLGKYRYSHFTSPIRRYPDLLLHQQLFAADAGMRLRALKTLSAFASECSAKEENSDNAYFAANDRLKIHYLVRNGALENSVMYEAVISKVSSSGLLCDIADLGLYGFVPASKIRGGGVLRSGRREDRHRVRAAGGHARFKVGDFIYLILDSVDLVRGTAVFRPAV